MENRPVEVFGDQLIVLLNKTEKALLAILRLAHF